MASARQSIIENTRIHLHIALDIAEDPEEQRHIREALQLIERLNDERP